MDPIDVRSMMNAAAATTTADGSPAPARERRKRLSPAALEVTNRKVRRAYSTVVINGAVRVADFLLLSTIGIAIYLAYVMPINGFMWEYVWAIAGVAAIAVISFQAAEIYDIQVFRGQLLQMTRMA